MIVWNLLRVCLHLCIGLWTCALVFPFTDDAGRAWRIKHWSVKLLAICGIEVEVVHSVAGPLAPRALIVANHISWLDIFVINTLHPCRFVAKSDIRNWPLIGWLCDKSGTIFIARGKLRDVRRIYEGLVHSLQVGEHVAFFPEGTTSLQGTVLPFHSNLFEAAVEAQVPVQPFALRYVDAGGGFPKAIEFVGDMTFVESMVAILKAGRIRAELIRLPLIETAGCHRRELGEAAREAISSVLSQ
ncbi:MAG: 1-acyl-sn-glycerol-3-phosphate acyltransferase [Proteobacteria bacterium]|nr:1-acyl-sn-glycerol-3-phosphate acyltransferase [Pseudomonadota bacterium]